MSEDFYDALGVDRDASEDEIRAAYRKRAAQYHPDVSDEPDAEEKFKRVKKAKEVLTDDEKRRMYDQLGHERFQQAEKHGATDDGGAGAGPGGMGGNPFGGAGGGGGLGDIFEQFFGGQAGGRSGPRQGEDLRTAISIDLQEAFDGVEKRVTVRRPERCEDCNGTGHPPDAEVQRCPECDGRGQVTEVRRTPLGQVQQTRTCRRCSGEGELYSETCRSCRGDGRVQRQASLTVEIPAGIQDGQTLRMEREGAPGERGASNGDLLIDVSVEDHPEFDRDGADLHHRHPISFPQAVFGASVAVPTLDGSVEMDVPAGTQSGERFRLREKGMPRLRGTSRGDLYVTLQVVVPEEMNAEQREALEAFAEAGGEEVEVEQGFFERIRKSF